MATSERRERILSAALECFNEHGIQAAAIADICARAKASIGSVYHHFGSKEGIATALLVEGLRRNTDQLEARLRDARGPREAVRTVVRSLIDWIAAHPDWARFIYTMSHGGLSHAGGEALQAVSDRHARLIDAYFGPHFEAGAFRPLPAECLPSVVIGPVHDYARRWLSGQVSGDLESHAETFAAAAWNAVRNPEQS